MVIINCANCGKRISITKYNAYDKIKKHNESCPAKLKLTKSIGLYLSNKAREYE